MMCNTIFMPKFFLGSGNLDNLFYNYPITPRSEEIRIYYLATLGFHVSNTFKHIFMHERRNDFVEMLLHHVLTFATCFGSYLMNWIPAGALIIFCLNIADIFVAIGKAFSETTYQKTTTLAGALMWTTWVYSRICCFSVLIYYDAWYGPS